MSTLYSTLPEGSIRLLKVMEDRDDGQVSCLLSCHGFDEAAILPYDAVSYVWGSPSPTVAIHVNGESVRIRQNLYEFLQQFSSSDYLWVDALCINQEDDTERAKQVRSMGKVYGHARTVFAWMAQARDPSVEKALIDLSESPSKYMFRIDHRPEHDRWGPGITQELKVLSQCEYWQRAWVAQEFLLAKRPIIVYGRARLEVNTITILLQLQEHNGKVSMAMAERHGRRYAEEPLRKRYGGYSKIQCDDVSSHDPPMNSLCKQRGRYQSPGQYSLLQVLDWNHMRKCLEPRDRIYSILSLAFKSEGYPIDVDYDAPIETVFCDVLDILNSERRYGPSPLACAAALRHVLEIPHSSTPAQMRVPNHEIVYAGVSGILNGKVVDIFALERSQSPDRWATNLRSWQLPECLQDWLGRWKVCLLHRGHIRREWKEQWYEENRTRQDGSGKRNSIQLKRVCCWNIDSMAVTFEGTREDSDGNNISLDPLAGLDREWPPVEQPQLSSFSQPPADDNRPMLDRLLAFERSHIQSLIWAAELSREISQRTWPPTPKSMADDIDVNDMGSALLVVKFKKIHGGKLTNSKGWSEWDCTSEYVLGLGYGDFCNGDQTLKLFDLGYNLVFTIRRTPSGTRLSGCIIWPEDPQKRTYTNKHPKFPFPEANYKESDWFSGYKAMTLQLTAEEILHLTD